MCDPSCCLFFLNYLNFSFYICSTCLINAYITGHYEGLVWLNEIASLFPTNNLYSTAHFNDFTPLLRKTESSMKSQLK